jgi:ATP dependent DNA ligase domain
MLPRPIRTDGFVAPCIPSRAPKPPSGPDWVHEVKHDGYRLLVRRDGATVRLFTRRGYDWTDRYPAIANAASRLKARSFTLDGEAVVCGADGVAVFDALHRRHDAAGARWDVVTGCHAPRAWHARQLSPAADMPPHQVCAAVGHNLPPALQKRSGHFLLKANTRPVPMQPRPR